MAKKSLKRTRKKALSGATQEKLKRVKDHLTPFQDENSSVRQSWFHDLTEWYAEVLFPNLQDTNNAVELVRREFWMVDVSGEFDERSLRRLADEALNLLRQLEEQHTLLDQHQKAFEIVQRYSHDLSDSIEVINSDLMSLLGRLRNRQPPA